jgi:DNA-binding beta-propeller fold protein YncE
MNPPRSRRRTALPLLAAALVTSLLVTSSAQAESPLTLFESGQPRPLALSPDGKLLFAVNTPDNRLEIFRVKNGGLTHRGSVPVGIEPVAVAVRSDDEVWVVNHLSDSISVVELSEGGQTGHVVRTLLVGDEPRDIVFAGPGKSRAFITTAHRGQNAPYDPQLTTPGVGRADVWVFDANQLGASLGGTPLTIVSLFSDTPRALAVTPDGATVYAAAFHSGNRTATVTEQMVPDGGEAAGGLPEPNTNLNGDPQPEVGLIVKFNGTHWVDELGRTWDHALKFSLPDKDVFAINAMANPPVQKPGLSGYFKGVGTILFNMAVNPVSGKVYVSNTEAFNEVRFEGPGTLSGSSVRGHLHESRITVLSGGSVTPRHLNKHINYAACCAPIPNAENAKSLALPQAMAITSNGATLYVAALGSSKIGVFDTAALENNTFVPSTANQIAVSGGGPTGIVLNESRKHLYVLTRFDNSISTIDTQTRHEVAHVAMHNPEPASIKNGRRFFYDAALTSSHGDSSCASCHVFGDFDSLAWDLGNPDIAEFPNPGPFIGPPVLPEVFNSLKGPMTTQSLRGMANHGPMHWRGDRTGGNDEPTVQPDGGTFNEEAAFKKFNPAFVSLLGRSAPLSGADMQAFSDFILQVTYPPNPIRALDNSLTADQQAGRDFYFGPISQGVTNCNGCHTLDPEANPDASAPGFFGVNNQVSFDFEFLHLKIPHLRNQYQKVGMFGMPDVPIALVPGDNQPMGDQVRGFGFLHDGSFDTVFRFMRSQGFSPRPDNPDGIPAGPAGDAVRRQIEAFMLAFDSNMAPIVGQQTTLTEHNAGVAGPRINLLIARANAGECDLVVKGSSHDEEETGYLYIGGGHFLPSRHCDPTLTDAQLRHVADHDDRELTYTCVPPGSGERIAIDRDGDGALDGDEEDEGSDPADPTSTP